MTRKRSSSSSTGPGVTPPSQSRKGDTRRAVLDTTLSMIREKGIDKVSWRGIARAVGYSPAGLYEYFDNKDDIVAALAAEGLAMLDRAMRRAVKNAPTSVEARLSRMGHAYIRFAHDHPGHFHLVFSVLPSSRRSRAEPAVGAYGMVLADMQLGIADGVFEQRDGLDAEAMAYGYWSLVHGLASLQTTALRDFEADLASLDDEVIATFLRGLRL